MLFAILSTNVSVPGHKSQSFGRCLHVVPRFLREISGSVLQGIFWEEFANDLLSVRPTQTSKRAVLIEAPELKNMVTTKYTTLSESSSSTQVTISEDLIHSLATMSDLIGAQSDMMRLVTWCSFLAPDTEPQILPIPIQYPECSTDHASCLNTVYGLATYRLSFKSLNLQPYPPRYRKLSTRSTSSSRIITLGITMSKNGIYAFFQTLSSNSPGFCGRYSGVVHVRSIAPSHSHTNSSRSSASA